MAKGNYGVGASEGHPEGSDERLCQPALALAKWSISGARCASKPRHLDELPV